MIEIIKGDKLKEGLLRGISAVADAVKVTMGAKGKTVIIDHGLSFTPLITKDGVTVARNVMLKDKLENVGAKIIIEAAVRTAEVAGDGSTCATVLSEEIFKQGLKSIKKGFNSYDFKNGMDKTVNSIIKELEKNSKPIKVEEIEKIALVSANWDKSISALVKEAINEVGVNGTIAFEEGKGGETFVSVQEGFNLDCGLASPMFFKQGQHKILLNNAKVLLLNGYINDILEWSKNNQELFKFLNSSKTPLLIIAKDYHITALEALTLNLLQGNTQIYAMKLPGHHETHFDLLNDIAVYTNGDVLMDSENNNIKNLGNLKSILIQKNSVSLIGGQYDEEKMEEYKKGLYELKDSFKENYDKDKMGIRIDKLKGKLANIIVGSPSEAETKEKKDRIEDALFASLAALEEGIVAGGGIALLRASMNVSLDYDNDDEKVGGEIVLKAIQKPFKQILENAEISSDVAIEKIKETKNINFGLNVKNGVYCDMMQEGIVDPLKVVKEALKNSVSVVSTLLTSECILLEMDVR